MSIFDPLRTNFTDDVLNTSVNTNIRYIESDNGDGTISLIDATSYTNTGDQLNAGVLNSIGTVVNAIGSQVTSNITDITANASHITWLLDSKVNFDTSASAGTVDGDLYNALAILGWESDVIV